ncbi:hypothetical protein [Pseudonocardia spirodelae]|uniref:DNA-binding transcriptional regulator of glucitol operon n=1 Tax=Pseudonocardia spirodelae TaxID=3133431 RepID=A0ABU8T5P4_9PSEU
MRLLLSPKWMAWHVLTLGAMVACTWLAVWQWGRAGSAMGSALNVGYGLQWPLFAVFFGVMWWRFLRMEIADLRAAGSPATTGGTAAVETGAGAAPASEPEPAREPAGGTAVVRAVPGPEDAAAVPEAGPSPFTSRPAGAAPPRSTDPQLRAYNQELARLAARHREESTP